MSDIIDNPMDETKGLMGEPVGSPATESVADMDAEAP
jgi:hypothetical protein